MIEHLPNTTVSGIAKQLVRMRSEGGVTTLGRVLTLVIVAPATKVEEAVTAANLASREHPMRIIALAMPEYGAEAGSATGALRGADAADDIANGLDAEIRVGRDAGAGDVIVLRPRGSVVDEPDRLIGGLLLPDAPVVVWWESFWPGLVASSPLGRIAQRRITDSGSFADSVERVETLVSGYRPGDTDLAWSRLTLWRAQLAAALDNAPEQRITGVTVNGTPHSSSTLLLAAWLRLVLDVPVRRVDLPSGDELAWGIHSVAIHAEGGDTVIERCHGTFAAITQPGHPRLEVPLPRRALSECIAEDLRLLRPDALYGRVLTEGVPLVLREGAR